MGEPMKRFLAISFVSIVAVAMAAPATAKKVKPPKNICWAYDGGTKAIVIGFKNMSSIRLLDGKTDFYSAHGVQTYDGTWFPASGAAFIRTPSTQEMTVHLASDVGDLYSFEIWWDLDDWTGKVSAFTHQQEGDVYYTDLTAIDCEALDPTF